MDVTHDADAASAVNEADQDVLPSSDPEGIEVVESPTTDVDTQARASTRSKVRHWLQRRKKAADPGVDWAHGTTLTTKLLQGMFALALIAGPIALAVALLPGAPAAPASTAGGQAARTDELASDHAKVAAEQLVTTWLTATQEEQGRVRDLVAAPPTDELSLPEKRPAAPTQVWAADTSLTAPSTWQVIVGVITGGQTTWYSVAVHATAESAQALSLPGHAATPATEQPRDPFPDMVDAGDPAAETVAGYVQALLTGTGDLDRWTSPDAQLASVESAPCETAELLEVRATADIPAPTTNGEAISVLASALCVRGEQSTNSQYPLTLTARDGRWEVSHSVVTTSERHRNESAPPHDTDPTPESSPTR